MSDNKTIQIPNNWSNEKKYLFRKMLSSSAEELFRTIARYSEPKKDHTLANLPPENIQDTIYIAKFLLHKKFGYHLKTLNDDISYFMSTGKIMKP